MTNSHLKRAGVLSAAVLTVLAGSLYLFARKSAPGPVRTTVGPSASASTASPISTPAAAPAKTNITWSPTSVGEILSPGESKTVSLSFISSRNIARVSVQVSSGLQSLIQVQPQFLDRVRKRGAENHSLDHCSRRECGFRDGFGNNPIKKRKKGPERQSRR